MKRLLPLVLASMVALSLRAQAPDRLFDLPARLQEIGERVAAYYARARSLVCIETVVIQPLSSSYSFDAMSRELKYELRVEWTPPADGGSGEAKVVRRLLSVGGRTPRPKDEPECMDPKPESSEPLELLLPWKRDEYTFKLSGTGKSDGHPSLMLDYRSVKAGTPGIEWKKNCVSVELPGRTQGRVWIDASTNDVLRLDEHLIGVFEFDVPRKEQIPGGPTWMSIERSDSSIRYKAVSFHDPDETLMLPASIETTSVIRNAGIPRVRTTRTFTSYRRFVTGGRIVG